MLALPIINYFKGDFPFIIISYFNMDQCEFFGNISRNFFSPFDPTVVSTVKIFLYTQIQCLLLILNAIEIKMVYRVAIRVKVLVDNGKTRAGNDILNPKLPCNLLDQRGLPSPHPSIKNPNSLPRTKGYYFLGSIRKLLLVYAGNLFHN